MKDGLYSVINIGASAFRMVILEFSKGKARELEYLIKPLRLGVDTFSQGYITLEHVKLAAEILKGFRKKLDEYKVLEYKAVCTSGVREARNKDFFIDYVRIHSEIDLEVLESAEEVYIKYVAARLEVENFLEMERHGVVFANIASGNVTLSISKGDKVLYSGTLPYGSLRLRQMFVHVPFLKRYKAFDQYVDNMVKAVAKVINKKDEVKYLVGGGSSINLMIRLFRPQGDSISRDEVQKLYKHIRSYSRPEIIEELNLREDEAAVIVPTLSTYLHLLDFANANEFTFSRSNFPTTLAKFYSGNLRDTGFFRRIRATLIEIAERYRVDIFHTKKVAEFSRKLFIALNDLHSLNKSDYRLLEAASLLHEVGYFIETKDLPLNSYYIIKSISIPGWRSKNLLLVACIVYQMSKASYEKDISIIADVSVKDKLLINKLACILKVADALDAGKAELIIDFNVDIRESMIIIDAITSKEPFVELAAFEQQKVSFIDTFGIPIDIRARVSYD